MSPNVPAPQRPAQTWQECFCRSPTARCCTPRLPCQHEHRRGTAAAGAQELKKKAYPADSVLSQLDSVARLHSTPSMESWLGSTADQRAAECQALASLHLRAPSAYLKPKACALQTPGHLRIALSYH